MLKKDQEFIDSFYASTLQEAISDLTKTQQVGAENFDIDVVNPDDDNSPILVFSADSENTQPTPLATAVARTYGGTWTQNAEPLGKSGWSFSKYSKAQEFWERLEDLATMDAFELEQAVRAYQAKFSDLDFSEYLDSQQANPVEDDLKTLIGSGVEDEDSLMIQEVMDRGQLIILWSLGETVPHGKFFIPTEDSNPNVTSILNTIMQLDPKVAAKIESLTPEIKTSFKVIGIDGYKKERDWSYGV